MYFRLFIAIFGIICVVVHCQNPYFHRRPQPHRHQQPRPDPRRHPHQDPRRHPHHRPDPRHHRSPDPRHQPRPDPRHQPRPDSPQPQPRPDPRRPQPRPDPRRPQPRPDPRRPSQPDSDDLQPHRGPIWDAQVPAPPTDLDSHIVDERDLPRDQGDLRFFMWSDDDAIRAWRRRLDA